MADRLFDEEFFRKLQLLTLSFRRQQAQHAEGRLTALQRGGRVEFADHRTYAPGDDLRYLDWRLYARTDRLFIKEFRKEEQPLAVILVDASASMGYGTPPKWDQARRLAAALAFIALAGEHAVHMATFAGGATRWGGQINHRSGFASVLSFLERSEAQGETAAARAARDLAERQPRPCLVVLLSDLMDPSDPRGALGVLAAKGYDLTVVHVLSPEELHPPWQGPRILTDAETRHSRPLVLDSRLLSLYLQELNRFREGWREFCAAHQMLYLPVSTATPFEELLLHYLRRGGLLK